MQHMGTSLVPVVEKNFLLEFVAVEAVKLDAADVEGFLVTEDEFFSKVESESAPPALRLEHGPS